MQFGQGQLLQALQENPQTRAQLRDAVRAAANSFLGQQGAPQRNTPQPPVVIQPRKPDYTPFYIAAAASIIAALIISRKK